MEINISEEEQRQCFIEQWNDMSVELVCEVPVFCRSVDLVAYDKKSKQITSIEFKTLKWKKAVEQVLSTAIAFDYMEICIQKPKTEVAQQRILEYCDNLGVGVYFFDTKTRIFEHALMPQKIQKIWKIQKEQVIEFVEKGDTLCKKL